MSKLRPQHKTLKSFAAKSFTWSDGDIYIISRNTYSSINYEHLNIGLLML